MSVLDVLSKSISNVKPIFEDHLPEFIPRLLTLSHFEDSMVTFYNTSVGLLWII